MDLLATGKPLPPKYNNHLLHGDYKGYWECHINHNWLLLYEKDTEIRIISPQAFSVKSMDDSQKKELAIVIIESIKPAPTEPR